MKSSWCRPALVALAVIGGVATSGCGSTWVVVPHPSSQYTATDTLYGIRNGDDVRITFHFDTIMRVDTVVRVDTAWVRGTRTLTRVDTILRVDTVRVPATRTVARVDTVVRVDTVRVPVTRTVARVDTVVRVDTIRVPATTPRVRVDTIVRVDTLRVVVSDTVVRIVRTPGRRMLFVPPGHYPPEGQCRIWIHDLPPGQQARSAGCDVLGEIPGGAFILFGGDAWDFDYDWLAEAELHPDSVPPEIIGLTRRR
jgi:hypothetical protein